MDLFKPTLKKAFRELEKTLVKNIAHDLYDITFHENATEEELMLFYGGSVNREAMITDTRRKLDGDQRLLRFYQNNRNTLNEYATQDATSDFTRTPGSDAMEVAGGNSDAPSTGESSGTGPNAGDQGSDGPEDNADAGNHDNGNGLKELGGSGEPAQLAAGARPDDIGGGSASAGLHEDNEVSRSGEVGTGSEKTGSGEVRITLPTESEARRLELIRIEDTVGVIKKIDGDEAVVLEYDRKA